MSIVSSQIVADAVQVDGRRYVRERHTDHRGAVHDVDYLAARDVDATAVAAARATAIEEMLRSAEINANLAKAVNGELTFTFHHSTMAQNRTALRATFETASRWDRLTLGWVIASLNLSDNQLKTLFEVNDAGLPTIKSRLSNMATRYEESLAAVAEGT